MTKLISQDLRQRVIAYVQAGHSARAASRHYNVSPNFAIKLVRRWRAEGHIEPRYRGRVPGTGKMVPYHNILRSRVEAMPDTTLQELTDFLLVEHGLDVHLSTVSRCLQALGFTYKKNSGGHGTWARGCQTQTQALAQKAKTDEIGASQARFH